MNKYLQERVEQYLARYDTALLATCGPAGPQITLVTYQARHLDLHLTLPPNTDHIFNLQTQPDLVLFTPNWKLHGRMVASENAPQRQGWMSPVRVQPACIHLLSEDSKTIVETIDF